MFTLFRIVMSVLIAAAAILGLSVATSQASAGQHHRSTAMSQRRCSGEKVHWDTGSNISIVGFHDYGEAHFTANPGRCSTLKVQILCLNNPPFNNLYTKTSSTARGVGVNEKVACDLDDNGQRFSIDVNGHWREMCTAGGNPKCNFFHLSAHTTALVQRQEKTTCTHFIATDDGGQAFSLPPGAKVFSGEYMLQVPVGQAWKFCYPLSATGSHLIRLRANQSYCVSGYKHVARIFSCSTTSANQQFTKHNHNTGHFWFSLINRNGKMMPAAGNGSADVVEVGSGNATHWVTG